MKKMKLSNGQYFDCNENRDLVEDFLNNTGVVSSDTLQFVTDYWGIDDGVSAIIDYYDIQDEFEDYVLDSDEDE